MKLHECFTLESRTYPTGSASLALGVIIQAFRDLDHHPAESTGQTSQARLTRVQAMAWLTDTAENDWPFSLYGCCKAISLAIGGTLDPNRIAEAAKAGRRLPPHKLVNEFAYHKVGAKPLKRGKSWYMPKKAA